MKWTLWSARSGAHPVDMPLVMAIINATPDSFSDGGELDTDQALQARVKQILAEGADIIDIGGESTRPGFSPVTTEDEQQRVLRAVAAVRAQDSSVLISIDTQKAAVASAALRQGADFINDISSFSDPDMAAVITDTGCSLVMMRNVALTKPLSQTCKQQCDGLMHKAVSAGINAQRLLFDPGLGFGDLANGDFGSLPGGDVAANFELVEHISEYAADIPVLIGASRKRFIGTLTGVDVAKDRSAGSLAVAAIALLRGAAIIRVHDVAQTVQVRNAICN